MTFNQLASEIAKKEGLKDQESIGNVREQLRITLVLLANMPLLERAKLLTRYLGRKLK